MYYKHILLFSLIRLLDDFEKAFDSISFEFIMTTLELFVFGDIFKTWIRLILGMENDNNFSAVTVVNGNISEPLEKQRGCPQGDPISGYLFIMAIEILDIYADDLTIYLEMKQNQSMKPLRNVQEVLRILETFQNWSRLRVNRGKICLLYTSPSPRD